MEEVVQQYRRLIFDDPKTWALRTYGLDLWSKQVEIVKSVLTNRRTAVKGCVASSKTNAAALVVHAFLQHFVPSKVFTTAPSARQVDGVLWGEVRALHSRSRVPMIGDLKPVASEWNLGPDWFGLGFSSNDPNRFHGWHGPNVLFIIDEAQGIEKETTDAIENIMADGRARILLLENPNALSGLSYDAFHSQADIWNCISIPAEDTPNYQQRRIVIPGMISYDQVQEWRRIYGPDSNFCRVKCDAKFPKQEADTIIPLDWIEAAWRRIPNLTGGRELGVDVARFGDDDSVIQRIVGTHLPQPTIVHGQDTMQITGLTITELQDCRATLANVDVIGVGAGVVDRLREQKKPVKAINVADKAFNDNKYANLRSELWFGLRELLDPANPLAISMSRNDRVAADLIGVKYKINSAGQIEVEPKKDTKQRNGRSPDCGDAVILACASRRPGGRPVAALSSGNLYGRPQRNDWE